MSTKHPHGHPTPPQGPQTNPDNAPLFSPTPPGAPVTNLVWTYDAASRTYAVVRPEPATVEGGQALEAFREFCRVVNCNLVVK